MTYHIKPVPTFSAFFETAPKVNLCDFRNGRFKCQPQGPMRRNTVEVMNSSCTMEGESKKIFSGNPACWRR